MGRSVETVSDATVVAYDTFLDGEEVECWECDGVGTHEEGAYTCDTCHGEGTVPEEDETGELWRQHLEWISEEARRLWPSMQDAEEFLPYPHRETVIVAHNAHSAVAVSEYSGVVAISLIPYYDRGTFWRDDNALGEHWRKQVSERFTQAFETVQRLGTFSNGEAVFQKAG